MPDDARLVKPLRAAKPVVTCDITLNFLVKNFFHVSI